MPYVRVLLSASVPDGLIVQLEAGLPRIIAEFMSVGEARPLTEKDIEIDGDRVMAGGVNDTQRPRVLTGDLAIIVWGENYPERVQGKDEIARRIGESVQAFMPPGLKAYIWIQLCEGGFFSFRS